MFTIANESATGLIGPAPAGANPPVEPVPIATPLPTITDATGLNPVEQGQTTVVGTVTPGLVGESLSLKKTSGSGTLGLGPVLADGSRPIIYTAPAAIAVSTTDAIAYTINEYDVSATGAANVALDAGPSIAPGAPAFAGQGQIVVIGLVTPGLPGDILRLSQASGSGLVSLGPVQTDGTLQVIYTTPSSGTGSTTDAVSDTVSDEYNDADASAIGLVTLIGASVPAPAINPTAVTPVGRMQAEVIGTVTLGLAGDSVKLTQIGGIGVFVVGGSAELGRPEQIFYYAPNSVPVNTIDTVSYTLSENGATATGTASVSLDAGPSLTAENPLLAEQELPTAAGTLTPRLAVEAGQSEVVATVTPGYVGDVLMVEQSGGIGLVSLGPVQADGTQQVIYTAPADFPATTTMDVAAYAIFDNWDNGIFGFASVPLDMVPAAVAPLPVAPITALPPPPVAPAPAPPPILPPAIGFNGDQVSLAADYPTIGNANAAGIAIVNPDTITFPHVEALTMRAPHIPVVNLLDPSVALSGDTISFIYPQRVKGVAVASADGPFDGVVITDPNGHAGNILGATIISTNIAGMTAADLSFSSDSVAVNFADLTLPSDAPTSVQIDVDFATNRRALRVS